MPVVEYMSSISSSLQPPEPRPSHHETETKFSLMPHPTATALDLFEAQVRRRPDDPCVRFGDRCLSYAEVDAYSAKIAACLVKRGVAPGDYVAVCAYHDAMLPSALIGIMRTGAAYVPIDPDYPEERIRKIIHDARPSAVLGHERAVQRLELETQLGRERQLCLDADRDEIERAASDSSIYKAEAEEIAYVIYTSGSTGQPKGVLVPHGALANLLCAAQREMQHGPDDRCLMVSSISFDISIWDMFVPLVAGSVCIIGSRDEALSGRALARLIEEHDITVFNATPAMWQMLLDAGWTGKPDLRASTAGEAVSSQLVDALLSRVENLWNGYGPTECTVLTTLHRFTSAEPPVAIGVPLPNTRCYVLDEEMRPVSDGEPGELWIGGAGVTAGYLRRPELTRERFVADPFVSPPDAGAMMYRSGDRVRWLESGALQCLDRMDNQVKVRGYRIELGEVESVLHGAPGVAQVVVRAQPMGKRGNALVAFVRPDKDGLRVDSAKLKARCVQHVRESLPTYMIPSAFVFVERFELGPTGKIDRSALREVDIEAAAAVPSEEAAKPLRERSSVAPRTPVEEALLEVFEAVLQRRLSIFDSFFSHGGDSLAAVQIVEQVSQRGLSVQPTDILRHQTVAELASVTKVRSLETAQSELLVPLDERGNEKPLYVLHSLPGDLLHYGPLIQAMEGRRPIFGFQGLSSLDQIPKQSWSVESLAAHYVDVLQRFQPSGPYHLAGWCFGGLIAAEMARQLSRRGKEVGVLGLLEAWPYRTAAEEARRGARLVLKRRSRLLPALANKVRSRLSAEEREDPLKVFALEADSGPFKHRSEVYRRNMQAAKQYRSSRYRGKALLIKSSHHDSDPFEEKDYGWGDFIRDVDVVSVNATHKEVLREPAVGKVASALQTAASQRE